MISPTTTGCFNQRKIHPHSRAAVMMTMSWMRTMEIMNLNPGADPARFTLLRIDRRLAVAFFHFNAESRRDELTFAQQAFSESLGNVFSEEFSSSVFNR